MRINYINEDVTEIQHESGFFNASLLSKIYECVQKLMLCVMYLWLFMCCGSSKMISQKVVTGTCACYFMLGEKKSYL